MMHLMEEYAKHGKVKSSTQEKNKQESAAMRKSSNPAVKATDSQSAGNKEQREESTKIWKTIEQLSKSVTEANKKITELSNLTKMSLDKCNVQTVQKNRDANSSTRLLNCHIITREKQRQMSPKIIKR